MTKQQLLMCALAASLLLLGVAWTQLRLIPAPVKSSPIASKLGPDKGTQRTEHEQLQAKAKSVLARHRQRNAAFVAYQDQLEAFEQSYKFARELRQEGLGKARTGAELDALNPDQLAAIERANQEESVAHQRLFQAYKQLQGAGDHE